jgi:glycosyltransferase involved in cell wall biosynthesis
MLTESKTTCPPPSRLLFLRKTDSFGGSEVVILNLLSRIDYDKAAVTVASSIDVFSNALTSLKLPVKVALLTAPFNGGFARMFTAWVRYLVRLRPDKIVLAEGGFRDFPLSTVLASFIVARGNLWMMELHPPPDRAKGNCDFRYGLISFALRERLRAGLTKGILAVSRGVKDRLVNDYGYIPEKVSVVHNGIDSSHFVPPTDQIKNACRSGLNIPRDATILVSTARLHPVKRLDRLIRAFDVLSKEHRELWLVLTCDGPLREQLESLALSVAYPERIKFLGNVKDVARVLQASDIFVLSSDEEGFGLGLVEAMACGLLCISTRTVGPSEIIEDSVDGLLTERSYDGVLKGLERALRINCDARKTIGRRASKTVNDRFRAEVSASKGLAFLNIISASPLPS